KALEPTPIEHRYWQELDQKQQAKANCAGLRMTAYFIRRFLLIIPTFVGVTMIAFAITRMVPGGPLERAIVQMRMGGRGGEAGAGAAGRTADIPQDALNELKK